MRNIIVVNNPKTWDLRIENVEVISAADYLNKSENIDTRQTRIFNLCRSYRYQATGYYVSLLAEARGQRVFPSVMTIQDFASQNIVKAMSLDLEDLIQKTLAPLKSNEFILSIYFGKNVSARYDELSRRIYNLFQSPLLRAKFIFTKKWQIQNINVVSMSDVPEAHKPYLVEFAAEYFRRKRFSRAKLKQYRYDLAILVDPQEENPPSDKHALDKFVDAAEKMGFWTEIIGKDDINKLVEFDALFIRTTTSTNHFTYRFARRAVAEGLVVIDDPQSILRCTNKVYLAELLSKAHIPTPKSFFIHRDNKELVSSQLGFPYVLKQPDSSFSKGVVKVENTEEFNRELDILLKISDLIVAQEYMPSEFDWRIGILDRKPLFACKYFMAQGHWQIYNWREKRKTRQYGKVEIMSVEEAPADIVKIALKSANLIGNGFYGVDLKQQGDKTFVIEINDNPSVDSGVEDKVLKDELYLRVIDFFAQQLKDQDKPYETKEIKTV
ncbi:MAG: RimK family protein [Candidatus Omnitrophica bacterium]|nr:RimK family protein [Candidatus Omnitrophota bacterium]